MKPSTPNPWIEWNQYWDPRPVPYPRKCKCCGTVFISKEQYTDAEALKHRRNCMCITHLRTFPTYLESDEWITLAPEKYETDWKQWADTHNSDDYDSPWACQCNDCQDQ